MSRKDLVETFAREAGLTAAQADAAVAAALDGVVATVAAGDRVSLPGFGTIEPRGRATRSGRNPQTGEVLEIAASVAPGRPLHLDRLAARAAHQVVVMGRAAFA